MPKNLLAASYTLDGVKGLANPLGCQPLLTCYRPGNAGAKAGGDINGR